MGRAERRVDLAVLLFGPGRGAFGELEQRPSFPAGEEARISLDRTLRDVAETSRIGTGRNYSPARSLDSFWIRFGDVFRGPPKYNITIPNTGLAEHVALPSRGKENSMVSTLR